MTTGVKAHRPNRLTEEETLTSFEDWKNNLIFYLKQDTNFKKFLKADAVWHKSSSNVEHRGLESAEVLLQLKNFLGVIASLSPPLLHGDLIDDSTSLADIFKQLCTYYQFAPTISLHHQRRRSSSSLISSEKLRMAFSKDHYTCICGCDSLFGRTFF